MSEFTKGKTVYGLRGHAAELVAKDGSQFIVRPIYEEEDGREHLGEIEVWEKAFAAPPTEKLHADVAALDSKLRAARKELGDIESKVWKLNSEEKARADRIKQHEALAELDRYLAGEITHYVATHEYYPTVEIIPVGETIEGYQSASGYGLLTLRPSRS